MKRIASWDVVKCVAIFLVVWGHALSSFDMMHTHCAYLHRFIYSFHMPLFMMVSGFFSASSFQLNSRSFLIKKAKQLLLPALSWSLITCVYIVIVNGADFHSVFYEFVGNSWFLKTLFACFVWVYVAKCWLKNDLLAFVLSCSIAFVMPPGSFLQFNWLLPFFWGGYFFHKYQNAIMAHMKVILTAIFAVVLTLFYLKNTFYITHVIHIDSSALIKNHTALIVSFLWAATVSLTIILLVHLLVKKDNSIVKVMAFVGRYTLAIYVIQTIFLEKFLHQVVAFHIDNSMLYNFVLTPLIACVVIAICVSFAKCIEYNKYAALTLLGKDWHK